MTSITKASLTKLRLTKYRKIILVFAVLILVFVSARVWMSISTADRVYGQIPSVPKARVALVLGNQALPDGSPAPKLADRCDMAIALYRAGKVNRLLMSGDGSSRANNEPETMKRYAQSKGVPAKAIWTDPYGLRTYDSVYRAKEVFGAESIVIVTQAYHVPRSLFLSQALGVKACAMPSGMSGDTRDQLRECMACFSALLDVYMLDPHPSSSRDKCIFDKTTK